MSKNIVVFGATSAIAQEVIKMYSYREAHLHLVGRNLDKLNVIAQDAKVRGAKSVDLYEQDLAKIASHTKLLKEIQSKCEVIDVALIAYGTLPDQAECVKDWKVSNKAIEENGLSFISLLHHLGNVFEVQKEGSIAVISSVAGDKGRQSNYIYGTAKAMISVYMEGLRNRLNDSNVQVLTIKPGFVDTPMTKDFPKGPLWAKASDVAQSIVKAIDKKRNVIYAPFFWWGIMLVIKFIPEFIFKKLKL